MFSYNGYKNAQMCFTYLWSTTHLKNLCFASASNLLMNNWKTCSPDFLFRNGVQIKELRSNQSKADLVAH